MLNSVRCSQPLTADCDGVVSTFDGETERSEDAEDAADLTGERVWNLCAVVQQNGGCSPDCPTTNGDDLRGLIRTRVGEDVGSNRDASRGKTHFFISPIRRSSSIRAVHLKGFL